jgi:hypothetical protein
MFTIIHSDMFRLAQQLQPSHIHYAIFWVQQPLKLKISSISGNMMFPPSIPNKEEVMSGGSNRNIRLS